MAEFLTDIFGNWLVQGLLLAAIIAVIGLSWRKLFKLRDYRPEKLLNEYYKTQRTPEFNLWQNMLLEKYYGKEFFTEIFGLSYPVYTFEGVDLKYNLDKSSNRYTFGELCNNKELITNKKRDTEITEITKLHKTYENLMTFGKEPKIKYPKMIGFMLDKLVFDENKRVSSFTAWVASYMDTAISSHILEYECYLMYKKFGKRYKAREELTDDVFASKVKPEMKLRNAVHKGKEIEEVLSTGCNRASMLSVQLIIIMKDHEDKQYKVLVIRRSEDVSLRPGYYQFVPAGGFEGFAEYSENLDRIVIDGYFDVGLAIFREYLEELCGQNEFEDGIDIGESRRRIKNDEAVQKIIEMIEAGTAHLEFLGSEVQLDILRNDLSFVLRIDDEKYSENEFKSNHEGDKSHRVQRYPIKDIEKTLDVEKLNPPSAGLFYLLTKNHLYKEIISD